MDVVSLAEARETVANAPTSTLFDEKLQAQIKMVFDFADDSLKGVPNARREQITLGDYLQRHNYISNSQNNSQAAPFLPELLKRRLTQLVGDAIDTDNATIDWEYANVRTNPHIHNQVDAQVTSTLSQGKGINVEGTVDNTIEAYLNAKDSDELGDDTVVHYMHPVTGQLAQEDIHTYELTNLLREARRLT